MWQGHKDSLEHRKTHQSIENMLRCEVFACNEEVTITGDKISGSPTETHNSPYQIGMRTTALPYDNMPSCANRH